MKIQVLWDDMLWWQVNTLWGNVLPVPSASSSLGCVTFMKISIFSLWKTGIV